MPSRAPSAVATHRASSSRSSAMIRAYARVIVRAPCAALLVIAVAIAGAGVGIAARARDTLAIDTSLESYRARGTPRTTLAIAAAVARRGARLEPTPTTRRRRRRVALAVENATTAPAVPPPPAPPPRAPPPPPAPPAPPPPPPWMGFPTTRFASSALDRMILGLTSKTGVDGHSGQDEFHVIVGVKNTLDDASDAANAMRQACVLRRMIEASDGFAKTARAECFSLFNIDDAYAVIGLTELFESIRALSDERPEVVARRLGFIRERCEEAAAGVGTPTAREDAISAHKSMCDALGDTCGVEACEFAAGVDTRCMLGERVGMCDFIANVAPTVEDFVWIARMDARLDRALCHEIAPEDVIATLRGVQTLISWSSWAPIEALGVGMYGIMVNDAFVRYNANETTTDGSNPSLRLVFRLQPEHGADWVKNIGRRVVENFNMDVSMRNAGAQAMWRHFKAYDALVNEQLASDCMWAVGALTLTTAIILAHTKSLLVAFASVCAIVGSTILTHATYHFVYAREWFGVIHIAGVFISVGIAADDVFVIVAAWRTSERTTPKRDTHTETLEDIMTSCLSHSVFSIGITSCTTAVAFASNYFSKIVPIKLFGAYMATQILYLLVVTSVIIPSVLVIVEKVKHRVVSRNRIAHAPPPTEATSTAHRRSRAQRSVTIDLGDVGTFERMTHRRALSVFDPFPPIVIERLGYEVRPLIGSRSETTSSSVQGADVRTQTRKRNLLKLCFARAVRWRWTIVISSVAGTAMAVMLAARANINGDDPLSLWPKTHAVYKFTSASRSFNSSRYEDAVRVEFTFGVDVERSAANANMDKQLKYNGQPFWLDVPGASYDFADPDSQVFLLDLCHALKSHDMASHVRSNASVNCWISNVDEWIRGGGFGGVYRRGLPLPVDEFRDVFAAFMRDVNKISIIGFKDECTSEHLCVAYSAVSVVTSTNKEGNARDVKKAYEFWSHWFADRIADGPPETIGAFQSSDSWVLVDTISELKGGALLTAAYSLALAFCILFLCTGNLRCAVLATYCIASVVMYFGAFMYLRGWSLGIIESICVQILVGLAIDPISHVVLAYVQTRTNAMTKEERALSALQTVGGAITAGCVSTVAAASCLLGATIVFFTKFATFIVLTLTVSYLQAIIVLPLLLSIFGPPFRSVIPA